jgi:hypothetical protein
MERFPRLQHPRHRHPRVCLLLRLPLLWWLLERLLPPPRRFVLLPPIFTMLYPGFAFRDAALPPEPPQPVVAPTMLEYWLVVCMSEGLARVVGCRMDE